tara:strand:+ start:3205 stop:3882 length:678 start_codon:yes stop_codon:yes gene_type:complete
MGKLYYGNGNCSIIGSDIRVVIIRFRGAIEIDDKTSDSFAITTQKDGIVIFPLGEGSLNNLFDYVGEFKIVSVDVAGGLEKIPTTIHRVMDYTELLNTKAEDMTTKSEDLSSTHTYGRKVTKTILKQPYIPNRHTSKRNSVLYLKDEGGELVEYHGDYHIHLSDNAIMTGREHTEDSQDLYYKSGKPTKNPSLIPYGVVEQNKKRKAIGVESRLSKQVRRRKNGL